MFTIIDVVRSYRRAIADVVQETLQAGTEVRILRISLQEEEMII